MKQRILICFLSTIFIRFIVLASAKDEDSWIEPDAWARDHHSLSFLKSSAAKCCKCVEQTIENEHTVKSQHELQKNAEDVASIIYLKKFITMLFNRKYLRYESSLQIYERSVVFTLQPSQLDELEQLQDPRDLDSILTEIFENVRFPNMYTDGQQHHAADVSSDFVSSVFQIFYNMLKLTKMSEVRFLLVVIVVILFASIIKNRFKIGLLTLILGGVFIYGYLYTYLECNREMEVNKMLEILKRTKGEEVAKDMGIIKFLKSIFTSVEAENLEHETLKKSAKLSLGFCRPDHVLIMYFNDIFLKYLQVMLEQCSSTIKSLNETLSFPYNIISQVFLISTICYIIKLTFKYILSPSAWLQFANRKQYEPKLIALTNAQSKHNEDRISGENLKLLLNAITGTSYQNTVPTLAVSGVQEVNEASESPPKDESKNIETNSVEASEKSNSATKLLDVISDVTLEDLADNS